MRETKELTNEDLSLLLDDSYTLKSHTHTIVWLITKKNGIVHKWEKKNTFSVNGNESNEHSYRTDPPELSPYTAPKIIPGKL